MPLFEYGKAEEQEVADMMTAMSRSLLPFRERNVPALLMVFALTRLLRGALTGVGFPLRDQLAESACMHIKGEAPDSSGLIIPSGVLH